MTRYLIRRLLLMIPTLLGISVITFFVVQLAPGDPVALKSRALGDSQIANSAEVVAQLRALYGLDKPWHERYLIWIKQVATLDFGRSFVDHRAVTDKILERMPISLQLSITSIFLAYILAIPLGVSSALHRHSLYDRIATFVLFVLYSLPSFWVALVLILFLGGGDFWNLFPVFGLSSPGASTMGGAAWFFDRVWHLVLPVFCLTYGSLAGLSRYARSSMLDVVKQDYIRTARAKGLAETRVVYWHALRNCMIPLVTLLAFQLPAVLGGSVIIESIFSIPGMGKLAFEAIVARDYPVIMGIFTISSFLTLVGFLLADLLYVTADPRIRYS